MQQKRTLAGILGLLLGVGATPAFAALEVVETNTETTGVTTVTWNSSFQDLDYDCNPFTLTEGDLGISVDAGDAEFVTFTQKKYTFTPKSSSKKQKVEGNIITGDDAMVEITSLHFDSDRDVYIGNVHLKWKGEVDEDGIGGREAMAHHGVNVHLEANGNCTAP